jgi:phospholipid/cholesterol/gamma-HCH transport system permease protein
MPPASPTAADRSPATARWDTDADGPVLRLDGDWRGGGPLPPTPALPDGRPLRLDGRGLTHYDSRLASALWTLGGPRGRTLDTTALPEGLREVLSLAGIEPAKEVAAAPPPHGMLGVLGRLGLRMRVSLARGSVSLGFIGEVLQASGRAIRGHSALRGDDLLHQIRATGPASLPIVSLVSFLVGLIIAYMGAAQLQRFGAQIYMADLVTIGEVREIAALMTGIILAGRVGAAFAAQLGSMQANEEIDALRSLGLEPVEHLVLPRVMAMALMAPLLTTYAAAVGMLAGMLVAVGIYRVEPLEYAVRSFQALTLAHVGIGLLKGTVYAVLVALAGCRQGLNAGRSAEAVGDATTAAVVQAIVWMVVAASAMTIMFQRLGW